MAQVTMELRNLLETDFNLFDFDYSFDDLKMKKEIEQHVIDHYYFSEIGQESPDRFKHIFKTRYRELVEYYNKLHNTALLEYNPLINYKMTEALDQLAKTNRTQNTDQASNDREEIDSTTNENTNNTRTDNLNQEGTTNERTSDYPQQPIAGGDYAAGETLTESNQTNTGTVADDGSTDSTGNSITQRGGDSSTQTTGEDTTNTEYEKTIEGLTGVSYQELINQERSNIIRIKQMIVTELKPCFILTY